MVNELSNEIFRSSFCEILPLIADKPLKSAKSIIDAVITPKSDPSVALTSPDGGIVPMVAPKNNRVAERRSGMVMNRRPQKATEVSAPYQ